MNNGNDWRSKFLQFCGPGLLAGIRMGDWVRLLRTEGVSVDWARLPRVVSVTSQSLKTTLVARFEERRYRSAWEEVELHPPVFVLGHWRSGTTYLHELLARDPRFGFPNSYQVSFPHTFLTTEKLDTRLLSFFIPPCRPMDNMPLTLSSPQEDEFALAASTLKSPCLAWVFPGQRERFEKYLTFGDVSPSEIAEWREAFVRFLKKVQLRCGRPLVLKSPPHTARIRLLLELFPNARFIHIHRNPFRVFQSCRRALRIIARWHELQRWDFADLDESILRVYRQMYDAFFADRELIPAGRFREIGFEQLERDPIAELRNAYEALGLDEFQAAEPHFREYLGSVANYRKTELSPLAERDAERIAQRWRRSFDEWGYRLAPE